MRRLAGARFEFCAVEMPRFGLASSPNEN